MDTKLSRVRRQGLILISVLGILGGVPDADADDHLAPPAPQTGMAAAGGVAGAPVAGAPAAGAAVPAGRAMAPAAGPAVAGNGLPVIPGAGPAGRLAWCDGFAPGHSGMTMNGMLALELAYRNARNPAAQAAAMQALQGALSAESLPALYRLMSDKKTEVRYASFDDPEGMVRGFDGQQGLRVIFQREIDVGRGNPVDKRLISAITFWKLNPATMKLELLGGPDAIRIRTQLVSSNARANFYGSAMALDVRSKAGKVTGIQPVAYHDAATGAPIAAQANVPPPGQCLVCHFGERDKSRGAFAPPVPAKLAQQAGYKDFADHYQQHAKIKGNAAKTKQLTQLLADMKDPKKVRGLFTPSGLVDKLKEACDTHALALQMANGIAVNAPAPNGPPPAAR
jgi:hypothetical protein